MDVRRLVCPPLRLETVKICREASEGRSTRRFRKATVDMLFALIAIAWLVIAALCWGACAMAARADAESSSHTSRHEPVTDDALVVWEGLPEMVPARDLSLTAHGVR